MKSKILGLLAVVLVASPSISFAGTWYWSFNGGPYGGTGTFTTDDAGPIQLVTGITGVTGGMAITGLVAPGGFGSNDNLLIAAYPQLTAGGISFSTAAYDANLLWNATTGAYRFMTSNGGANTVGFEAVRVYSPVPEPGTLALLGLGLAGLGLSQRRKAKRCSRAVDGAPLA